MQESFPEQGHMPVELQCKDFFAQYPSFSEIKALKGMMKERTLADGGSYQSETNQNREYHQEEWGRAVGGDVVSVVRDRRRDCHRNLSKARQVEKVCSELE